MADIQGKFYNAVRPRTGTSPSLPPTLDGDPQDPVNPPGTGGGTSGITIEEGQVAFGTGVNTIGGESDFTYDNTTNILISGLGVSLRRISDNAVAGSFRSINTQDFELRNLGGTQSYIQLLSSGAIAFGNSASSTRWAVLTGGTLQSNGPQSIASSSGSLSLQPSGTSTSTDVRITNNVSIYSASPIGIIRNTVNTGYLALVGGDVTTNNGANIELYGSGSGSFPNQMRFRTGTTLRLSIISTGEVGIGNITPTNTLDVNGTARIRTISNATGNFLTTSATGVIQQRTAAQVLTDISAIGGSGTINEIAYFTATRTIASLPVATYPSLTELSYVKGVTSSIQTQLNGKQATIAGTLTDGYVATVVAGVPTWAAPSGGGISGLTTNRIPKSTSGTTIGDGTINDDSNGIYNTGKGNSTFFGYQAGLNDDGTDNSNTFIGYNSGRLTTTAFGNAFFGKDSGYSNITSGGNSFFGNISGYSNNGGVNNAFFGASSGYGNTTGSNNAALGTSAGTNQTTGGNNTFVGSAAGSQIASASNLTIANNSVFVGFGTRANANSETNQTVIGYSAVGNGSNTTTIGNTFTTDNYIFGNFNIVDARNFVLGTTTGTKIGTATTQLLSFWNKTPIVQPTTGIAEATFVENAGGTVVNVDSTFGGYTLQQIAQALINVGLLA